MPAEVDTMAYAGTTPWHKLGQPLEGLITTDQMRVASGLTWEPKKVPLVYPVGHAMPDPETLGRILADLSNRKIGRENALQQIQALTGEFKSSGQSVLVRDDTGAILTHVGPEYEVIQNAEVFEFFREYAELGQLTLETAGSLQGGEYVWCLASFNESFTLAGDDTVKSYVLLANPHLYGKGAKVKPTKIRVVCWNTFTAALRDGEDAIRIWHNAKFDAERRAKIQKQLSAISLQFKRMHEMADALVDLKLDVPDARSVLLDTFAAERHALDDTLEGFEEHAPPTIKKVMALYQGEGKGATMESAQGTGWGLLNAVTEYVDWTRGKNDDNRMQNAWFGDGEVRKQRAAELLLLEAGQPDLAKVIVGRERIAR